jgi:selenocysteine lyase/cysteine desulfurase
MHPRAAAQYSPLERTYLDTAGYGLPPAATVTALTDALAAWRAGSADWVRDWDVAGDRTRPLAAHLLGADAEEIALIPAVSVGVGVALSALRPGEEILLAEDEFASVTLPALVAASQRGLRVRTVAFEELADAVRPGTTLVATSHVRSNDGRVQDLAAVAAAARSVGAAVLVDATHAAGVLPVEADRLGLDYVVAAAYKHLLCPRGVAFLRLARSRWPALAPWAASWRSAGAPYDHYYGPDLGDLAASAARFDVSLAWHAWVGAEASLRFLCSVPAAERLAWCAGLASALADRLGLPATGSSLLTVPFSDGVAARAELRRRRITASGRGGQVRISFHLYNDDQDMVAVAAALEPWVAVPTRTGRDGRDRSH